MTTAPAAGHAIDPLDTIPLFDVKTPPTPARAAALRDDLAALDTIRARRRELDQHEHDLIAAARRSGATWQQIVTRLGYNDRQAAQQRHQALARALAGSSLPSRTRTQQR